LDNYRDMGRLLELLCFVFSAMLRRNSVMPVAIETSEVAILSRVIRPDSGTWSKEAAESILDFDFPPADVRRMNALAAKARQGKLTAAEHAQLDNYRDVGRLLELLQSKARLSLKRSNAPD